MKVSQNFKLIGISMLVVVGLAACGKQGSTGTAENTANQIQTNGKLSLICEYIDPKNINSWKKIFDIDFDTSTVKDRGDSTYTKSGDNEYGTSAIITNENITLYSRVRTGSSPFIVINRITGHLVVDPERSGPSGICSKNENKF